MSQRPTEETPTQVQKRLNKFLDCVARLLAKRSLREQRQDEQREMLKDKNSEAEQ
jgi:hypothetical protein